MSAGARRLRLVLTALALAAAAPPPARAARRATAAKAVTPTARRSLPPDLYRVREHYQPLEGSAQNVATNPARFHGKPAFSFSDYMLRAVLEGAEVPIAPTLLKALRFNRVKLAPLAPARDPAPLPAGKYRTSPFGQLLASAVEGSVMVDLGAGDPTRSLVPRYLGKAFGAAGYVAVDGLYRRDVETHDGIFVSQDMKDFLRRLGTARDPLNRPDLRGKRRIFVLNGIEPANASEETRNDLVRTLAAAAQPSDYVYVGSGSYMFSTLEKRPDFELMAKSPILEVPHGKRPVDHLGRVVPLPDMNEVGRGRHAIFRKKGPPAPAARRAESVELTSLLDAMNVRDRTRRSDGEGSFIGRAKAVGRRSQLGDTRTLQSIIDNRGWVAGSTLTESIVKLADRDPRARVHLVNLVGLSGSRHGSAARYLVERMATDPEVRALVAKRVTGGSRHLAPALLESVIAPYLEAHPESTEFDPILIRFAGGGGRVREDMARTAAQLLARTATPSEAVERALWRFVERPYASRSDDSRLLVEQVLLVRLLRSPIEEIRRGARAYVARELSERYRQPFGTAYRFYVSVDADLARPEVAATTARIVGELVNTGVLPPPADYLLEGKPLLRQLVGERLGHSPPSPGATNLGDAPKRP